MRNGLSGKAENLDKIGFKVPFAISSADKDIVKILNEFQIEHTWRGEGSDHIHLAEKTTWRINNKWMM